MDGIVLCVGINDYKRLRPVCMKTNTHICIIKRCGLPFFVNRIKKRHFLLIGMAVISILMLFSSNFIWSIEVAGDNPTISKEISDALFDAGLYIGAYKPKLSKIDDMKNTVQNRVDNLVWVWVNIKGTKATVEYLEGVKPPQTVDKSQSCNIVASKSGIITSIITRSGIKMVNIGDACMKDDILVLGSVVSLDNVEKLVHSDADIYATTFHKLSGTYKLNSNRYKETGRRKSFYTVKVFSKCFDLFLKKKIEFKDYHVNCNLKEVKIGKDNYFGIGLYCTQYCELVNEKIQLTLDEALEAAKNDLEMKISKNINKKSKLLDKKVEYKVVDKDTITVTVSMQFSENIAKQQVS